ncbi:nucleoside phosphorylase domain-containing protein [Corynascus novoguineensis]|uniref:Nucleoside phosphorylase domain-containing protein n=1 Tax=Corynascus novoguineensis TaxID=1126955 RepID=A0AAN7HCT4_9PEZI|nr:nucleoside phosphorylase domain-containing protein [Corynascus novoguineensis]
MRKCDHDLNPGGTFPRNNLRYLKNAPPYGKAAGDPNAYTTGAVGRHNVVLAHMPGMGKVNATAVAAKCPMSFPNIRLAIVVGICGVVPFGPDGDKIILGVVIVSEGVIQYDSGRQQPEGFVRRDTFRDALGRADAEIRNLIAKLKTFHNRKNLQDWMDVAQDRFFEATYHHKGDKKTACTECGCNGKLVPRTRLGQGKPLPAVHFGWIASRDALMRPGEDRDATAEEEGIITFEMVSAGVWDIFHRVVLIKGACDYADTHKNRMWQRYAAATAAACMKAFLRYWLPSQTQG